MQMHFLLIELCIFVGISILRNILRKKKVLYSV